MTSTTLTALPNDANDSVFNAFERLWKVIIERDKTIKSRDKTIAARDLIVAQLLVQIMQGKTWVYIIGNNL